MVMTRAGSTIASRMPQRSKGRLRYRRFNDESKTMAINPKTGLNYSGLWFGDEAERKVQAKRQRLATPKRKAAMKPLPDGCIRVLSVRQPFADELVHGTKPIEFRTWSTNYRGRLYIHASRWDRGIERSPGDGVIGAIVGSVNVVAVFNEQDLAEVLDLAGKRQTVLSDEHKAILQWHQNRTDKELTPIATDHFWLVDGPQVLATPIPTGGKLNLWTFPATPGMLKTKAKPKSRKR